MAVVTSDARLLAHRELDDALGLTTTAGEMLADARTGKNGRHALVGLLRPWGRCVSDDGKRDIYWRSARRRPARHLVTSLGGATRLPKTLGRGRFGMEPTAIWGMQVVALFTFTAKQPALIKNASYRY
jgi:hypothetical protein